MKRFHVHVSVDNLDESIRFYSTPEAVATAGLILVVMGSQGPSEAAWRVSAWIGAAYWFTASTSFANPAITIGRALSNTFAGIAPSNAPAFIASQLCGALAGLLLGRWLLIGRAVPPQAARQGTPERRRSSG
jgi:glycerol uptake facilitator-like aquaporin